MCNIEKIYQMLDWDNEKDIQNKAIELSKSFNDLIPFFQPIDSKKGIGKNIWKNCAKIIADNSDKVLEKYIYKMLEWLEDLTWPGATIILDRLNKMEYSKIRPVLCNTISIAMKKNKVTWLENLKKIVKEKKINDDIYEYITNYYISDKTEKIKKIPKLINNLSNNKLVLESLINLSEFHDSIFLSYFYKYNNSNDNFINSITNIFIKSINELIENNDFNDKLNKKFLDYLLDIINDNCNINRIINDLNNSDLRFNALRVLNLYCLEYFLPYFKKYKNDENLNVRKIVDLSINNIKYYGY